MAARGAPWLASIQKDRRSYNLGDCATAEEAAERYNPSARELFGDLVFRNGIPGG
jgi:hypothetical protein